MGELWRRLWFLLNRRRFERELQDEMDAHRAMKAGGEAPFGNTLRLRDEAVDAWGWRPLERLVQDLRFGVRLLWRSPAFTLTAILVLALGVGVNLAAFQIFERLALAPRPVREPDTLVHLYRRSPQSTSTTFAYPAFDFYRRHGGRLASPMARVTASVSIGEGDGRRATAVFVSGNYFPEMGGAPLAGRLLAPADDDRASPPSAVVSEDFWRAALGGDMEALRRPLLVNGHALTIVGFAPRPFVGLDGRSPALWIPVSHHAAVFPGSTLLQDWTGGAVEFYARVPPDVPAAAVVADLRRAVDALRRDRPNHVWDGEWLELRDAGHLVALGEAAPAFALVAALVALVLVAACMNLGLLVLARTLVRGREFAIRLSVGATRRRLARQLLTEHLLLGLLGTAAGCLVAMPIAAAVFSVTGESPAVAPAFTIRTVVVAGLLAVLSSMTFGFAPLWQTLKPESPRRLRLRNVMLTAQVAAATALLSVSGLLVRGVTRTVQVPLGFDYQHTFVADPDLLSHGLTADAAAGYWNRVAERVRQQPGVAAAAVSSLPPLGDRMHVNAERTVIYEVTPGFFDTLQIAVRRGRIFLPGERGVVVVGEALARRRWSGQDPLGQNWDGHTVIGVVADARTVRLNESGATEAYRALTSRDMPQSVLIVRTHGDPQGVIPGVRALLQAEDARLTPQITALADALDDKLAGARQAAQLVSALGICALLLAATGLAGMVAFTVSERLREIGVRLALGARPADVVRAIVRQFRVPLLSGAAAGSLLAGLAGMILASELYGISSLDPAAHLGAFALFLLVTALATLPSLRRALRVDPIQILRHE
jgi:predicted permease